MKRYTQTEGQLLDLISTVDVDWRDEHFEAVWALLEAVPKRKQHTLKDVGTLFDADFDAASTASRLILDLSKDAFLIALKRELEGASTSKKSFLADRERFLSALEALGITEALRQLTRRDYSWKDILAERLKSGRGSAIRGQRRGRALENFAEKLIREVFGEAYESRCSFVGADGVTEAKCDFAIPSSKDPRIVIESKAYGATGSKQSDVLGDVEQIIRVKRNDTNFLFVTDGETWRERRSDLRKLIRLQNEGRISRIYTQAMRKELLKDLETLRGEHSI